MRVIDLSAEELRVDSKERARNVDFFNGGGFRHHADIFTRSVHVLVAMLLLLLPGSNLRAARGEERHIDDDDEKNAFVCAFVRFVMTLCAYEFVLCLLFFRFFDLYKMSSSRTPVPTL